MGIGLESPPLLSAGLAEASTLGEAQQHLTELLESRLGPLERLVRDIARREKRSYTGIDVSPAPGKDASIGADHRGPHPGSRSARLRPSLGVRRSRTS